MTDSQIEQLLAAIRALPASERLRVAQRVIESLSAEEQLRVTQQVTPIVVETSAGPQSMLGLFEIEHESCSQLLRQVLRTFNAGLVCPLRDACEVA